MIDFWNGIHTPDGAVWFNRFTNEYEFEKRPDGFDAYLVGKRAYNMMSKFDINDLDNVPEVDMTLVKRPTQKKENSVMDKRYMVKKLIYHGPATIVYWADGEKTVVKCMDADTFDPMAGFCAALAKKVYGSTGTVKQIIKNNWKEKN